MIGFDFQFIDTTQLVVDRANDASFKNVGHALASIRKDAQASIEISPLPSRRGTPPHSRDGRLARAIVFDVNKETQEGIVGPRHSVVGLAGHAHEFADTLGDEKFDERAFMAPALDRNIPRFGESFAGSF